MTFKSPTLAMAIALLLVAAGCSEEKTSEPEAAVVAAEESSALEATVATEEPTEVSEDEQLNAFFAEVFEATVMRFPGFQTYLGRKTNYDQWNERSEEYAIESNEIAKNNLQRLQGEHDFDALSPASQLSYRLFKLNLENQIEGFEHRHHGYPISQIWGAHTGYSQLLNNMHRIDTVEDANAFIGRIDNIPASMNQLITDVRNRQAMGILPPKFIFGLVRPTMENLLKGAPFDDSKDNPVFASFKQKIEPLEIEDDVKEALIEDASRAMLESFGPAYETLIAVWDDMATTAATDDGAWKFPKGEAYYAYQIRQNTTPDMTPEMVHEIGLAEVARIHGEIEAIMGEVAFEGSLQDFFEFMKTDEQFFYPNNDEGGDQLIADLKTYVDEAKSLVDQYFYEPPEVPLEILKVEEYREASAPGAFYTIPPPDASRPGRYYSNTADMTYHEKPGVKPTVFHETYPGHHMQFAITRQLKDLPMFRRMSNDTAFSEGWGLYAEHLAGEMGLYKTPYERFGKLSMELMRSLRMVVDTGIHLKKWTREEATAYMLKNSNLSNENVRSEVDRYIANPGQATAYKVGMMKFLELRAYAKSELGDDFDIRDFHQEALGSGAIPLPILEENIKAWVAREKTS